MNDSTQSDLIRTHRCPHCGYRRLLVNAGLTDDQIARLGQDSTHRRGPYKAGDYVYQAGTEAGVLYVVQSGAVKTQFVTYAGDLRISGFFLTGELFGLDALGESFHTSDAVALERTWVCEIPVERLESLCTETPQLQHEVFGLLSSRLRHSEHISFTASSTSAEQRVMCFLDDLYQRTSKRLGAVSEVRLPMRKADIANFLSLTPEHFSRILRDFENSGLIRNHFRSIEYLDAFAERYHCLQAAAQSGSHPR